MLPKYGKNPNANGHGRVLGPKTDTARVLGFAPVGGEMVKRKKSKMVEPTRSAHAQGVGKL